MRLTRRLQLLCWVRDPMRSTITQVQSARTVPDPVPAEASDVRAPRAVAIGLSLMAAVTLMLELALIRAFDVMLTENLAYMVISCALLGFGLAGIFVVVRPVFFAGPVRSKLARLAAGFALGTILLVPALNALPFDLDAVLQTIVERAAALCRSDGAVIRRIDGNELVAVAVQGDLGPLSLVGSTSGGNRDNSRELMFPQVMFGRVFS